MYDIKIARQSLHDLKVEGKAILDVLAADDRNPTASEEAKLKQIEADAEKAAVLVAKIEAEMDEERNFPVVDQGHSFGRSNLGHANGGRKFADMFAGASTVPNNGFSDLNELLGSVHSGLFDNRLVAAATGGGQDIGAEGGYLIPTEFSSRLFDAALEREVVRPRCDVRRMNSNKLVVAGFDTETHTSNIGGFTGVWTSEGTSATVDAPAIRKVEFNANKLMIYTVASNELAADGQDFESQLTEAMVSGLAWWLDHALLNGTGAGQPMGVLNDPAVVSVAKESGQTAATIVYQNLVKMFARLHPASLNNSVWIANSDTIPQLLQVQQIIENQAGSENVGGAFLNPQRDSDGGIVLLTRPVVFTEKLPTLGTVGDLMLVDLSQYTLALRPEVSVQKSMHIGFQKDETAFRVIVRGDGKGRWSGAVTPKVGSTLSWAVSLATRA